MAVIADFLKWLADDQPMITRCADTHPHLYRFCKAKNVAAVKSIARELKAAFAKDLK